MNTPHLDHEIERLTLLERTNDLSTYGKELINEYKAIKEQLRLHNVSGSAYLCKNVNGDDAIVFAENIAGVFDKLEDITPNSDDVEVIGRSIPHYR